MSKIFFTDMHANYGNSLEDKFNKLMLKANLSNFIHKGELVAIKVHVGERGNLGYLNHNYARLLVHELKQIGAKPFLTDTNTLYSGGRHNAVDHYHTANMHGYNFSTIGAPFIVADGLRGLDFSELDIQGKHVKKAKIAKAILECDKIIFLSHFKGHLEAGFGGSIKNLAMGCSAIAGKQEQHSSAKPVIDKNNCVACAQCARVCPEGAISIVDKIAVIDYEKCVGCGQCIAACNFQAVMPSFDGHHEKFLEKMCEYAYAVNQYFNDKAYYFNFGININPDCDCWPANEVPIVHDIGILASNNPLALDKATINLVNKAKPNPASLHAAKIKNKENIFKEIRSKIPVDYVFEYCKQLGMDDQYEIEEIK